ncbi:hypothetical protein [Myroides sp. C4067]|uniref:hypothetical protein n=1 Tax=Myroides sp. C4067 TaxID=3136765 RepID=UPI0031015DC9
MKTDVLKFYKLEEKEQVITLVKYKGEYKYFLCDREYWVMDWNIRYENYSMVCNEQERERFSIRTLDETNCDRLINELREESVEELQKEFFFRYEVSDNIWDLLDIYPVMLVDFDACMLYVLKLYEAINYEMYIPLHWEYTFVWDSCISGLIPDDFSYWKKDNVDYLALFAEKYHKKTNDDF